MASGVRSITLSLGLGAFLVLNGAFAADPAGSTGKLVRLRFSDPAQLEALNTSGQYEVVEVKGDRAIAIQHPAPTAGKLAAVLAKRVSLAEAGVAGLETVLENVDDQLAQFRAQGNVGKYHTYASALAELADLCSNYPNLLKSESIGKSYEGRDLMAVRLTGSAGLEAEKPKVLIFGLMHAREWISAELPFYLLRYLLTNYGKDPEATKIVDNLSIYILPVSNPDGLEYSQTQFKMWRKNRSPQDGGTGVDVNRNFTVGFGAGSSDYVDSDVYHGKAPNSELETRAFCSLFEREKFIASLSFHSYSELVLYSWGKDTSLPPDAVELTKRGKAMADLNGYTPGQVARILYTAGGATDDTFYQTYGAWAFTFELGTEFVPADKKIEPICKQNLPAVLLFLKTAIDSARPTTGIARQDRPKISNFFSLYDIYPLK
ncbi:MAG: zinc carboxypeptidase [Candidatus Wallbacteria bacterium]|nr:zinc carboxypeptidase [Candidatus Wallbacteria bacterium]